MAAPVDDKSIVKSSSSFRRRVRGYDRTEVNAAMGIMRARIEQLEYELDNRPQIIIDSQRDSEPHAQAEISDLRDSWFERRWEDHEDPTLDAAFDEFFIGADVVRSPWSSGRRT